MPGDRGGSCFATAIDKTGLALMAFSVWTKPKSTPAPVTDFWTLGAMRKLTTSKTSFHVAAVLVAVRTSHLIGDPLCA